MRDEIFIDELGLMIVVVILCVFLVRCIGMSSIVVYLFVGLVLGSLSGLVQMSLVLVLIFEIGIVLLLFLVGLELSLVKIRDVGRVAVVAGVG